MLTEKVECSITEKAGMGQGDTKFNEKKAVTNVVDTNPTISIITLKMDSINIPIKKLSECT